MQSSRGMFTFSVLDWKFLFWVNLVLKIEIVIWSWISYWGWYEYADFNRDAHFFCFRPEIPFLGKLGPAIQNCYFKQKFGTSTNLNMQNSIAMLIFFCFIPEISFFGKFGPKIKIVHWAEVLCEDWFEYLEFNSDESFFCFRPEIPFLGKYGPKNQKCYFKLKFNS